MKKYNWRLTLAKVCMIVYITYKQPNFTFLSQVYLNLPSVNRVEKNLERNRIDSYLLASQISNNQSFYQTSITQDKYINEVNVSFEKLTTELKKNTLQNIPDYQEYRQRKKQIRRDTAYHKYKNRRQVRTLFDLPPLNES